MPTTAAAIESTLTSIASTTARRGRRRTWTDGFPDHEVLLGFNSAGPSTFAWVTVVTPGEHTIEILVHPQYGGTGVFLRARTLTIEVYKP
jgi:hypothetical protein